MAIRSLWASLAFVAAASGAGLAAEPPRSLFTDLRPVGVDDVVTILIQENAIGVGDAETNTDKKVDVQGTAGTGFLDLVKPWGAGGTAKFEGTGTTSRNGRLVARLSARVVDVRANGNLALEGKKVVKLNQDEQVITVTGVVRPQDIGPNNTVFSSAIADARIEYSGKGAVTTGQRPGVVARVLNWIL
jgi:flagellar L-ring protein precursor FlgH